jgi:hypothetical protein
MQDERFAKLAKLLVEYSIRLKRNETVLIEAFDIPDQMTAALIRAARAAGGVPFAQVYHARVNRALALEASDRQLNIMASHELARMKKMNAYIAMRGSHNVTELADVPAEKMQLIGKKMRPVQDQRVKRTKWVVLRWPTPSMAQLASELGLSSSQIHLSLKRLQRSHLVDSQDGRPRLQPIEEFLVHGVKYAFPAQRGEPTRGMPTAYAAPPLRDHFAADSELPPVWPSADGRVRGITFEPLHKSAPKAAAQDPVLYELLALLDALREGRARERQMAERELRSRLRRLLRG